MLKASQVQRAGDTSKVQVDWGGERIVDITGKNLVIKGRETYEKGSEKGPRQRRKIKAKRSSESELLGYPTRWRLENSLWLWQIAGSNSQMSTSIHQVPTACQALFLDLGICE